LAILLKVIQDHLAILDSSEYPSSTLLPLPKCPLEYIGVQSAFCLANLLFVSYYASKSTLAEIPLKPRLLEILEPFLK